MYKKWIACILCLALTLSCLAGCSSKKETPAEPEAAAAEENGNEAAEEAVEPTEEAQTSEEEQGQTEEPESASGEEAQQTAPAEQPRNQEQTAQQPASEDPAPAPAPAEETPVSVPAEEPAPEEPAPSEEPAAGIPDGTYTISIGFSGGTGKASISSPVTLYVKGGSYTAKVVWTSVNYDYMKVNGVKYLNENNGGNSTFTIPVPALDTYFSVIGDTVAMSTPHEIEYTLYFDSTTLK